MSEQKKYVPKIDDMTFWGYGENLWETAPPSIMRHMVEAFRDKTKSESPAENKELDKSS